MRVLSGPSRRKAWAALALLAALLFLVATRGGGLPDGGRGSATLIAGIVEGLRSGGDYYPLAATVVHAPGGATTTTVAAVPLPTLAVVAAALPAAALAAMLWMLAGAVALAWQPLVRGRDAALALLVVGCGGALRPSLALAPELWAGLFVALSLARRRPGDAAEAIGWGVAATLIAPVAGIHLLAMATMAMHERFRHEAAGWLGALAVAALVVAAHLHALAGVAGTPGLGEPGWLGPAAAMRAIAAPTLAGLLPAPAAAIVVVLALAGWTRWNAPPARRALATLAACALLLATLDTEAGGGAAALLIAPLVLAGLAFVPALIRDLVVAALDRRRITVRRVAR